MPRDIRSALYHMVDEGFSLADLRDAVQAELTFLETASTPLPILASNDSTIVGDDPEAPADPGVRSHLESTLSELRLESQSFHRRYEDLGPLGRGGMGEVRRVRDRRLGRTLAMKTLHNKSLQSSSEVSRFFEEAQATAQLQHPGVVPIHDIGVLPDGRVWFTMKEVAGQTLREVIAELHAPRPSLPSESAPQWTLRRVIDVLSQVCDAVGFAHSRGVVHRDLKPDNVMVGQHGEVMVLDWGLARVLSNTGAAATREHPVVETDRGRDALHPTRAGQVAGTPSYMAPEQARGELGSIGARTDVYALGAVLFEVLSGQPPYVGSSGYDILQRVRSGPPPSLASLQASAPGAGSPVEAAGSGRSNLLLPPALIDICEKAMARSPADRFSSASDVGKALREWMDGAMRREMAISVVDRAAACLPAAHTLRTRAMALEEEAKALLSPIEDWRPEAEKYPGWKRQEEAARLHREAARMELKEEVLLRASLTHEPSLSEAHAALAMRYRRELESAEIAQQDTTRHEAFFRQHLDALPASHPDRPSHFAWLKGEGALTLHTDPPGAEVLLYRYIEQDRRLQPVFERHLGVTPVERVPLPMGSYLCILQHPQRAVVRYPVSIGRNEHWHGIPPGQSCARPVPLPHKEELGPEDCYVPPGWFWCGGDPKQERSLQRQRLWVDGWIFRRFPVTNRAYLAFLDQLVAHGRVEEALHHVPRERAAVAGQEGQMIYEFDGARFSLRPDADGDLWLPDWPVTMIPWHAAQAFATREASRTGRSWRLPDELAWEKAARGVDGRFFPWGNHFDASRACMRRSHPGRMTPPNVGEFPADESPFGLRGMAGGVQDWCADPFRADPLQSRTSPSDAPPADGSEPSRSASPEASSRVVRGGGWLSSESCVRVVYRDGDDPTRRSPQVGFRLARPYP